MSSQLYNNVTVTLAGVVEPSDTEITVSDGSVFPDPSATGDYIPVYVYPDGGAHEIMHVTAVAGNVLTVARAQENTDPLNFAGNENVQIRPTRQSLAELDASSMVVNGSPLGESIQWIDDYAICFNTLADILASTSIKIGDIVKSLGYDSAGDGGANYYEVKGLGPWVYNGGKYIYHAALDLTLEGLFLDGIVRIKQFGAKTDGTDTTPEVQAAFSFISQTFEGRFEPKTLPLYINVGEYRVSSTITAVSPYGVKIYGAGMQKSVIYNDTTSDGILDLGIATESAMQFGSIDDIWLRGNAASTYGMKVMGVDDSMSRTSRANSSRNLYISDIGSGPTLILNAWCWNFTQFNSWNSLEGVEISRGANGITFYTPYISGHTGSAIVTTPELDAEIAKSAAITFIGGAIQRSGVSAGKRGQIDLRGGFTYAFQGVFFEGLESTGAGIPDAICYTTRNVSFRDCFLNPRNHADASLGPDGSFVIADSCWVTVDNFRGTGEAYDSVVRLEGTAPKAIIKHATNSGVPWVSGIVNDQSTLGEWSVEQSSGYGGLHLRREGINLAGGAPLNIGNVGLNTSDPAGRGSVFNPNNDVWEHQKESTAIAGSSWFRHYYGSSQAMVILNDGSLLNSNGSYSTLSDSRFKTVTGTPRSYLEDLLSLDLVKYKLNADIERDGEDGAQELLGLIAQDVQQSIPGLVGEDENGTLYLKTSVLIFMLLQAVQEMNST